MPWRAPLHTPHAPQRTRDYRREEAQRLQDPALAAAKQIRGSRRWQRLRLMHLARFPMCADPFAIHLREGRSVPATQVDHRRGLRTHPELAFEPSNLQSLCGPCHSRKSTLERSGELPP